MIAAYSAHRPDSVTAALGIHLIVYCSVGACLAFGLYCKSLHRLTTELRLSERGARGGWPNGPTPEAATAGTRHRFSSSRGCDA